MFRRNEAASKPRKEFIPKTLADLPMSMGGEMMSSTGRTTPSGLTDGLNGTTHNGKLRNVFLKSRFLSFRNE